MTGHIRGHARGPGYQSLILPRRFSPWLFRLMDPTHHEGQPGKRWGRAPRPHPRRVR
jgi:hypothetical protein